MKRKYSSKEVAAMRMKTNKIEKTDRKVIKNARKDLVDLRNAEEKTRAIVSEGKKEMTEIKRVKKELKR